MRYAIIKHKRLVDLVAHVNAAIKDRWIIAGGVAFGSEGYAQAMVTTAHDRALPFPPVEHDLQPQPFDGLQHLDEWA